jgi:hypothetical protein
MLYSYIAQDKGLAIKLAMKPIDSLLKKHEEALLIKISGEEFADYPLDELLNSNALFKDKYIVVLNGIFANTQNKEKFLDNIKEFKNSKHIFFLVDKQIDKKTTATLKKNSEKYIEKNSLAAKKKDFNIFLLPDALLEQNRVALWKLYREATMHFDINEIYGVLWWAIKNLKLLTDAQDAKSVNMKDFVFNKNKRALQKMDKEALSKASLDFISLPYKSRERNIRLDILIEKWILSLNFKKG